MHQVGDYSSKTSVLGLCTYVMGGGVRKKGET